MKRSITIEGYTPEEILHLPDVQIAEFIFCDEPLVFKAGSTEVLGEFRLTQDSLIIELAQISGGGEGVLLLLWDIVVRYGKKTNKKRIEWIVHAIDCTKPNLKV